MTTSVAWGRVAPLTERGVWVAAQRGDQAAREELVRRYEPLVQATLRRMHLPRPVEREDIAQEARIAVLAAILAWRPDRGALAAFAARCIRNRVIDALDDAGRQKHQALNGARSLDMPPRPPLGVSDGPAVATLSCDQLADRGPGPEGTVLLREQLAAVRAVLPTLTAKEHQALLRALNGRCQQELAAELGWTAKMHKTVLRRARDKLVGMSDRVAAL
jgi:RNA polymerase sigma factor (sigma-70 family)